MPAILTARRGAGTGNGGWRRRIGWNGIRRGFESAEHHLCLSVYLSLSVWREIGGQVVHILSSLSVIALPVSELLNFIGIMCQSR